MKSFSEQHALYAVDLIIQIHIRLSNQAPEDYILLDKNETQEDAGARIFNFLYFWFAFKDAKKRITIPGDREKAFKTDFAEFFEHEDPENYAFSRLRGLEMRIGRPFGLREFVLLAMDYATKTADILGPQDDDPISKLLKSLENLR